MELHKTPGPDELHPVTQEHQEVIDALCRACREALNAIGACFPYVDFQHGLRDTAMEIEEALAAAERLQT